MHNTYVSGTLCSMLFQAVKINKLTNPERTFFFFNLLVHQTETALRLVFLGFQ